MEIPAEPVGMVQVPSVIKESEPVPQEPESDSFGRVMEKILDFLQANPALLAGVLKKYGVIDEPVTPPQPVVSRRRVEGYEVAVKMFPGQAAKKARAWVDQVNQWTHTASDDDVAGVLLLVLQNLTDADIERFDAARAALVKPELNGGA